MIELAASMQRITLLDAPREILFGCPFVSMIAYPLLPSSRLFCSALTLACILS